MTNTLALVLLLLIAALLAADHLWLHGTFTVEAARALDATIGRASIWQ